MTDLAPLIEGRKLSRAYHMKSGTILPLKEASLSILPGDSLSIMGPSGSGKSTLLHLLGCLDRPTSGDLIFRGQDLRAFTDEQLSAIRSQEIGFVFQSFNLLPHLTIYENVSLPFQYRSGGQKKVKELVFDVVEKVGLKHRIYHKTNELSGGEMQRAAIARALVISPSIILADEPTGNLDSANSAAILALLKEVNQAGVALVVITHDERVASQLNTRYRMQDGELKKG